MRLIHAGGVKADPESFSVMRIRNGREETSPDIHAAGMMLEDWDDYAAASIKAAHTIAYHIAHKLQPEQIAPFKDS
jgi:hypothetical protein